VVRIDDSFGLTGRPPGQLRHVTPPDVDEAHAKTRCCGDEIVHRLTAEPSEVRRLFVRAPDGN